MQLTNNLGPIYGILEPPALAGGCLLNKSIKCYNRGQAQIQQQVIIPYLSE